MHEYAVTEGLLKLVLDEAGKAGASKVTEIKLVIGDLSTIIDESIQMYFDLMSEGTMAHGARLVFRRIPARFKCKDCGCDYEKPATGYDCPQCGGLGMPTGVGREFYVESMDVE